MILVIKTLNGNLRHTNFNKVIKLLKSARIKFSIISTVEDLSNIKDDNTILGIIIPGSDVMVNREGFDKQSHLFLLCTMVMSRFNDVPVLGICFGCQLLNFIFGGTLRRLSSEMCDTLSMKIAGREINAYFCLNYVIKTVGHQMEVLVTSKIGKQNFPCLIKHRYRNVYGCLFHPEYYKETYYIIYDFVKLCTSSCRTS